MSAGVRMTRQEALERDRQDPLRALREEFLLPSSPNGEAIYLCGHSLGLMPKAARTLLAEELDDWQRLGVEGHFSARRPWYDYHRQFSESLAALAGGHPSEVVAMNSLTVNLHLLFTSFYQPTGTRHRILIERDAFSSDRYAAVSHLRLHGFTPEESLLEMGPRPGESAIREEDLAALIEQEGRRIALVWLPGVQFLSGQRFDVAAITRQAQAAGCTVGFDLAHAIGNVPLALHEWNVDFAVWCGYKYLNGGPGAIGGAFVHERHAGRSDLPRLAGWWGTDPATRFRFDGGFAPLAGAEGWQVSNPPILAMAPLLASLALYARAGLTRLWAKSSALTQALASQLEACMGGQLEILTSLAPGAHGAQLTLRLRAAAAQATRTLVADLRARGIYVDQRSPDLLRVAPVPLYNSYTDVVDFVAALEDYIGE